MRWSGCIAAALALVPAIAFAPTPRRAPRTPTSRRATIDADAAVRAEDELLAAIEAQRPIATIAGLFAELERACPAPEDLLDDPSGLDGPWWLAGDLVEDPQGYLLVGAEAAPPNRHHDLGSTYSPQYSFVSACEGI